MKPTFDSFYTFLVEGLKTTFPDKEYLHKPDPEMIFLELNNIANTELSKQNFLNALHEIKLTSSSPLYDIHSAIDIIFLKKNGAPCYHELQFFQSVSASSNSNMFLAEILPINNLLKTQKYPSQNSFCYLLMLAIQKVILNSPVDLSLDEIKTILLYLGKSENEDLRITFINYLTEIATNAPASEKNNDNDNTDSDFLTLMGSRDYNSLLHHYLPLSSDDETHAVCYMIINTNYPSVDITPCTLTPKPAVNKSTKLETNNNINMIASTPPLYQLLLTILNEIAPSSVDADNVDLSGRLKKLDERQQQAFFAKIELLVADQGYVQDENNSVLDIAYLKGQNEKNYTFLLKNNLSAISDFHFFLCSQLGYLGPTYQMTQTLDVPRYPEKSAAKKKIIGDLNLFNHFSKKTSVNQTSEEKKKYFIEQKEFVIQTVKNHLYARMLGVEPTKLQTIESIAKNVVASGVISGIQKVGAFACAGMTVLNTVDAAVNYFDYKRYRHDYMAFHSAITDEQLNLAIGQLFNDVVNIFEQYITLFDKDDCAKFVRYLIESMRIALDSLNIRIINNVDGFNDIWVNTDINTKKTHVEKAFFSFIINPFPHPDIECKAKVKVKINFQNKTGAVPISTIILGAPLYSPKENGICYRKLTIKNKEVLVKDLPALNGDVYNAALKSNDHAQDTTKVNQVSSL